MVHIPEVASLGPREESGGQREPPGTEFAASLRLGFKRTSSFRWGVPMLMSGLSGNEIYCLARKGWSPGNIVVGNSVHSLGLVRGITSGLKTLAGGEIDSVTQLIADGRHAAIGRLEHEAIEHQAHGLTGVVSELKPLGNLMEFLAVGSAIHGDRLFRPLLLDGLLGPGPLLPDRLGLRARGISSSATSPMPSASAEGSPAASRCSLRRGEVKEFSDMYNHTRHLALERLEDEAAERGCNAVVDIITRILPFGVGVREMLMVGTGSYNPALGQPKRRSPRS